MEPFKLTITAIDERRVDDSGSRSTLSNRDQIEVKFRAAKAVVLPADDSIIITSFGNDFVEGIIYDVFKADLLKGMAGVEVVITVIKM